MKQTGKKVIVFLLACVLLVCQIPQQVLAAKMEVSVNNNLTVNEQGRNKTELPEWNGFSNQDKIITDLEQSSKIVKSQRVSASEGQVSEAENIFYYEQEFSQEGVRVVLSAREGVVPDNCNVQVMLLMEEMLGTLEDQIQKEMQGMIDQEILRSATGSQSVFDKYYDLRAKMEHLYAVDVKITYTDEAGELCIFEPKERDAVTVSIHIDGLNEVFSDEMRSVELFYMPQLGTDDFSGRSVQIQNPEYLTERAAIDGDIITFDAKHFSIYTVAILRYAAYASQKMIDAQKKAWNLINNYADPQYFLNDPLKEKMTESQYKKLRQEAVNATKDCHTQYEKIQAITGFVASEIYYDYRYLNNHLQGNNDFPTFWEPHLIWENKRAVCGGYANFMRTLLISIGIPCMYINGDNHAYNVAYDSTNKRWIFADSTWCSKNEFTEEGEWVKQDNSYQYFDLPVEQIAALTNHEIYHLGGLLANNTDSVYYQMDSDHDLDYDYYDMVWSDQNWHLQVLGVKGTPEKITISAGFEGLEVYNVCPNAFFENKKIKSVDFSHTKIENIREDAFGKCSSLTDVKFPPSLQTIERYSFRECPKLKTVDLSKTKLQEVADKVFFSCSGLTKIKLPKSIQKIDLYAFGECKKLTSINLQQTKLSNIGESAFRECKNLSSVNLSQTELSNIGKSAFRECKKLASLDLSQTKVKSIGDNAFDKCSNLSSVKLPKYTTVVEMCAFWECYKLKNINLAKVKKIGYAAFYECKELRTVDFSSLTNLGEYSFRGCRKLKVIDLSKAKLKEIPNQAFNDCSAAKLIKIPITVKSFGEYAFSCDTKTLLNTIVVTPLSAKKIGHTKEGTIWFGRKVSVCAYTYKIKFNKNGGKRGSMPTLTCGGGIKTKLPVNKFKRPGYKFKCWNTKKNGRGTVVANKGTVRKLARKDNAVVTLYAQWKKVK